MREEEIKIVKVVLTGDSGVGKTLVARRLKGESYIQKYTATILADFSIRFFEIEGQYKKLQLWDLAGAERFRGIRSSYYKDADVVLLFCDVENSNGLNELEDWLSEIGLCSPATVQIILVGNRADATSAKISKAELEEFQRTKNLHSVVLVDAKTGHGIDELKKAISLVNGRTPVVTTVAEESGGAAAPSVATEDEDVAATAAVPRRQQTQSELIESLGDDYENDGLYKAAISCYDDILKRDNRNAVVNFKKGGALFALNCFADAIFYFDLALSDAFPDNLDIRHMLFLYLLRGQAFSGLARHEEAIYCFDRGLRLIPESSYSDDNYKNIIIKFYLSKGEELRKLKKYESAINCLDRALCLNPASYQSHLAKGNALNEFGRHQEAIECYEQVILLDRENGAAYYGKGTALNRLREFDQAKVCFEQALRFNTQNRASAYYEKGMALNQLGNHQEAIECFTEALKINPNNIDVYQAKGEALNILGQYEEAVRCFDAVLKIDSINNVASDKRKFALSKMINSHIVDHQLDKGEVISVLAIVGISMFIFGNNKNNNLFSLMGFLILLSSTYLGVTCTKKYVAGLADNFLRDLERRTDGVIKKAEVAVDGAINASKVIESVVREGHGHMTNFTRSL